MTITDNELVGYAPREVDLRCPGCGLRSRVPLDLEHYLTMPGETLVAGPVTMNFDSHIAHVDGEIEHFPLKEWDLLEIFVRNPGRVLPRMLMIERVWGNDYVGDTKTLDVHVKRLRQKIEENPRRPRHIVTIRGLGYRFDV